MEHKWRKSKLDVFYLSYHKCVLNYNHALSTAKAAYFPHLISKTQIIDSFFDTVFKLTQKQPSVSCPSFMAYDLLHFFCRKIDEIQN